MKDSGVEWLGKIPAHWGVKPLKRLFANLDSRRVPLSGEERATMTKEYPYYGASGIIDQVEHYLFDEPLILVAESRAGAYRAWNSHGSGWCMDAGSSKRHSQACGPMRGASMTDPRSGLSAVDHSRSHDLNGRDVVPNAEEDWG
jgi:hypothetical protein